MEPTNQLAVMRNMVRAGATADPQAKDIIELMVPVQMDATFAHIQKMCKLINTRMELDNQYNSLADAKDSKSDSAADKPLAPENESEPEDHEPEAPHQSTHAVVSYVGRRTEQEYGLSNTKILPKQKAHTTASR